MELVYLWVEDYKNIHRQGFNFSPRFNCHYDVGSNELTIDENDDYIDNFFGDNINVTAIVGKNGSGKSSILKLVLYLIFCKNYKKDGDYNIGKLTATLKQFPNKEIFLLLHNGDEFKKITFSSFIRYLKEIKFDDDITNKVMSYSTVREEEIIPYIKELNQDELNFFTIHFNYMLDTMYDGEQDNWIKEIYHKADTYKTPLLLEPYKNNNNKQLIDLDIIEYLNNQNMLRFYAKLGLDRGIIVDFFKINEVDVFLKKIINPFMFTISSPYGNKDVANHLEQYGVGKEIHFLIYKFFKLKQKVTKSLSDIDLIVASEIDNMYKQNEYFYINKIYIALKVLDSDKSLFNEDIFQKIQKWFDNIDKNLKINFEFKNLLKDESPEYEIRKIKVCLDFENERIYDNDVFKKNINRKNKISIIKAILEFIPPWIEVEWFEDSKSIKSLSSGEKTFLTFIINLMYQIQNINDRHEYKTINLFLDETELGFHPQWQKEYLLKILKAIRQVNKKKVNLLFATHSAFLLSDIPKQNIIFLDKDEDGNCKVVDGLKDKKQTFGANIHTLLSDSFFMEDGLMGEFAKGKINEIIEFHKEVEENKKDKTKLAILKTKYEDVKSKFWDIQSIIGEDYLQQVIKNHLRDTEFLLGYKEARVEEIKRLRAEADRLESLS